MVRPDFHRVAALATLLLIATTTAGCQARPITGTRRFASTLIIKQWITAYGCPASASRLPPITVSPLTAFSASEACAVAWHARNVWIRAAPKSDLLKLQDTSRIARILIQYIPAMVMLPRATRFERNQSFNVVFEKTPSETTVVVAIDRNTGRSTVALGHPPAMNSRLNLHPSPIPRSPLPPDTAAVYSTRWLRGSQAEGGVEAAHGR